MHWSDWPDWFYALGATCAAVALAWSALRGQERLRRQIPDVGLRSPSAYRVVRAALGFGETADLAQLRPHQVATLLRGLGFALATSAVNVAITTAVIFDNADGWRLSIWIACVGGFLAFGLRGWVRTRHRPLPPAVSAATVRKIAYQAMAHGAIWGGGFVAFYADADGTGRALLLALALGIAAGGIASLSSIPAAALGFSGALLLPTIARLGSMGDDHMGLTALFVCFFGVMGMSVGQAFDSFASNVIAQLRHKEAAQTVALLLNTYEEQAADWLWIADEEGRLIAPPERMAGLFGKSRQSLDHVPWTSLEPAPGSDGWHELKTHLAARTAFHRLVLSVGEGDHRRWIALSGRFAAEDARWHGVGSDVTARETATRALRVAVAEAETASAAKSTFLASMSHELRTPLNAIIGFSELMTSIKLPMEKHREYTEDIARAGRHLLSIVNDILDITRLESGAMELSPEPVNVAHLVGECRQAVFPLAERRGVTIDIDGAGGDIVLVADARAMRQILLNLLGNAIKFTPAGGHIAVRATRTMDEVEILVDDDGIGIDAKHLDRIMQPFAQVEGPYSRKYEGTGLGLPIARRLAELHGGALGLSSGPGRGTVARFTIPTVRPEMEAPPARTSQAADVAMVSAQSR